MKYLVCASSAFLKERFRPRKNYCQYGFNDRSLKPSQEILIELINPANVGHAIVGHFCDCVLKCFLFLELDVNTTILSWTFDGIGHNVTWRKVESGSCKINFYVQIKSNSQSIWKGPTQETSIYITDIGPEANEVQVTSYYSYTIYKVSKNITTYTKGWRNVTKQFPITGTKTPTGSIRTTTAVATTSAAPTINPKTSTHALPTSIETALSRATTTKRTTPGKQTTTTASSITVTSASTTMPITVTERQKTFTTPATTMAKSTATSTKKPLKTTTTTGGPTVSTTTTPATFTTPVTTKAESTATSTKKLPWVPEVEFSKKIS